MVADWGTLEDAVNTLDAGGRPATFDGLSFFNRTPIAGRDRISDLIRSRFNPQGYEWAFARATVKQVLDPSHGLGDEQTLGVFFLEDPTEIGEDLLVVRGSDWSLALERKLRITTITRDDFPNADPDDVGKKIPVIFGSLTNVPAYAIVAGAATPLAVAPTASDTTLTLTDTSAFPSTGTGQIDSEKFTWTGKTATTLTGVTRGVSSTTAAAHFLGAPVWEVRSGAQAYRFVVAENLGSYKVASVSNVRSNGVRTTAPTITLEDTALIAGRSFVTIDFAGLPFITPQGNIDTLAVSSTSATSVTRVSTNQPVTISTSIGGSGSNSANATMTMPAGPGGTITDVIRSITYRITEFSIASDSWSITRNGGTIASGTTFPALGTYTASWGSGTTYGNDTITISVSGSGPGTFRIVVDDYRATVEATVAITKTGTVTLSGNAAADVLFGKVTCDVEGIKDDSSGTISGTANLPLENPTDVSKLILTQLFPGVGTSDLGVTWATTRSRHATGAYKWALVLDFIELSKLRRKLGEQARSLLFFDGDRWQWKYLEDVPTAQVTLDYLKDIDAEESAAASRTPRTQLRNQLFVYSQRDHAKRGSLEDIYQRVKTHQDLTQPGLTDPVPYDLELDFVQDAATADNLGAFWLAQWKRQRFELDLVADWNVLALEKADYVAIANHPLLASHGGTNLVFRVTLKRHLSDGRIRLRLVEANA